MVTVPPAAGILAIDAGNSKTDVALVAEDGTLLATARGGGFRPHLVGAERAVRELLPLVVAVAESVGLELVVGDPLVRHVSACLANSDLPVELERLEHVIRAQGWGATTYVGNDTFAGVSDAAALENFLKVAILAKGSVDRIERQIDVVRQLEILIPHIDFHDFGA